MFFHLIASKLKRLRGSRFFSSHDDLSKVIAELNQEMESVFGEPPPSGLAGSADNQTMAQESRIITNDDLAQKDSVSGLMPIGGKGEAQMAVASCKVILGQKVYDLVSANQMEKGDVLSVARIAGICGATNTSNLIPLCHNINLTNVWVDLSLSPSDLSVRIEGEASSRGKTGVEMEALTAATIAGLTVYDMCKAASKEILVTDVRLESKLDGKVGTGPGRNEKVGCCIHYSEIKPFLLS